MVTLKAAGATGDLPGGNDLENEALELTQGDAEAVTALLAQGAKVAFHAPSAPCHAGVAPSRD